MGKAAAKKATNDAPVADEALDGPDPLGTGKGFIGTKVDPTPNEEYSLESGPDSPSASEAREAAASSSDE